MKLKELIKDIEVLSTNAAPDTEISGISYDSRLPRPGDLFVAIKGFETDGHRYIPKAMEEGRGRSAVRGYPGGRNALCADSRLPLRTCNGEPRVLR